MSQRRQKSRFSGLGMSEGNQGLPLALQIPKLIPGSVVGKVYTIPGRSDLVDFQRIRDNPDVQWCSDFVSVVLALLLVERVIAKEKSRSGELAL